jgi:hypothetical protein
LDPGVGWHQVQSQHLTISRVESELAYPARSTNFRTENKVVKNNKSQYIASVYKKCFWAILQYSWKILDYVALDVDKYCVSKLCLDDFIIGVL